MVELKLKDIEAIGNGLNLRDSLEHWKISIFMLLGWNILLTIGLSIIIVKCFA